MKQRSLKEKLIRMVCNVSSKLLDVEEVNISDLVCDGPAESGWLYPQNVVLIDVRAESERQISILPGAVSREEFEQAPVSSEEKQLIAYCTAGYRSGLYVRKMNAGTNISGRPMKNLRGGIIQWCHAGLPLVTPSGEPTFDVHVYSKAWNLVEEPYSGVW